MVTVPSPYAIKQLTTVISTGFVKTCVSLNNTTTRQMLSHKTHSIAGAYYYFYSRNMHHQVK